MKKNAIIKISVLFIIGMALGAMLMGLYVRHELGRMHHTSNGAGFSNFTLSRVEPKDSEREALRALTEEYGQKLEELHITIQEERKEILDELLKEGEAILDGKSEEEFRKHIIKMRKGPPRMPHHRKRGGKPPQNN